jgi:TolB-like protein/Tfp pilus assembly protein PilF
MADSMSSGFRLGLMGNFQLEGPDGIEIAIKSKKNKALIAILALSPKCTSTRDRLGDLLWGSHGEEQARASLRQSLAMFRKELGASWEALFLEAGNSLSLRLSTLTIDVLALLSHDGQPGVEPLRKIADLSNAEFLADIRLSEPAFEDWLSVERARVHSSLIVLLEKVTALESGVRQVASARELVRLDPLRESSHRILMRAYVDCGDASLALKQFEDCRGLLKRELQVEPSPETQTLREEIVRNSRTPTKLATTPDATIQGRKVSPQERLSIAVLPLTDLQSGHSDLIFADGVSEELITNLSRFRHLFVIARASSFAFRGTDLPPSEIGKKLGVKFLLYGTVRRIGDQLRVTAELVEAETDAALWRERYDRPAADVLDVLDELSSTIVASTVGQIDHKLLRGTRRKQTETLAAYELFLKGRALMHSSTWKDKLSARKFFEQAIEVDDQFAQAWAQLAHTYLYEFFLDDSGQGLDRARELAMRAMQIDEEEPWCHLVLGLSYLYRRQFDLALKHCRRSVQLNPSDPALSAKLGLVMIDMGDSLQALPIIRKAMLLNPMNSDAYSDYLALALMGARRFEEAAEVLESSPQDAYYYHAWLAICYAQLGDGIKAHWHGAKTMEMEPDFTVRRVAEKEPFRKPSDLALWLDSLRMAGVREE